MIPIILVQRGIDIWLTYRITPDLEDELNPLRSFGWTGMLLGSTILVAVIIAGGLWARRLRPHVQPPPNVSGFSHFLGFVAVGSGVPWWHGLWRLPPNWRHLIYTSGVAFPAALVAAGVLVTLHQVALLNVPGYGLRGLIERLYWAPLTIAGIVGAVVAFRIEYAIWLARVAPNPPSGQSASGVGLDNDSKL